MPLHNSFEFALSEIYLLPSHHLLIHLSAFYQYNLLLKSNDYKIVINVTETAYFN